MIYYIYANTDETFIEENKALGVLPEDICYIAFEDMASMKIAKVTQLLVTGSIDVIKIVMDVAQENNIPLGIVPLATQKELMRTFDLPKNIKDALAQAVKIEEKKIDVLYCNGIVVLQEAVIGDAPPLDEFDSGLSSKSYIDRIKVFWRTIKKVSQLKHTKITITDAKENKHKFSAVGVVAVEYDNNTFASKLLKKYLTSNDGKLSIVILSPSSMLQYVGYLFTSLVSHLTPTSLPSSVGFIRSGTLQIESAQPLDVTIDSFHKLQTPISLEVKEKSLALSVGEDFWKDQIEQSTKDSIKIDHLPSDEAKVTYLSKGIPLFSHASKEQYASLFSNLREESKLNQNFMVLLVLATTIATFGLFINSSSVIIGAMLLAPLMQPIVSLSMGVLRQDNSLQIDGTQTIAIGVMAVLLTSGLIALFTPIERLTSEMAGRLSPTILDLFVAIVSGMAAAYAKSNEKILGSLAGVAIAVALVPPIAVAGIGLGWGDWAMFSTAFLLFVTNLVGIVLAAAFTFVLLGFSPLHLAKKGMMIWLGIVMLVSIPLYSSFAKMQEEVHLQTTLANSEFSIGNQDIKLNKIKLMHKSKSDEIHCEVISTGILTAGEKKLLKESILKSIGKEVEVIATFRYKL